MTDTFHSYLEIEGAFGLSETSPEAHYAEAAWNEALRRMRQLIVAAHSSGIDDWCLTLITEIEEMDTGLRHE